MTKEDKPHPHERERSPGKKMSRRQFLTYTLGGTTAYMAAAPLLPMIRFAVDPLLQKHKQDNFIKVAQIKKVTDQPQQFTFKLQQEDGWYESIIELVAWIRRDEQGHIYALSPICKHLGCTIGWNNEKKYPDEYYCPCHGAHYDKLGKNLAVSPLPLDEYTVKVENGWVYLGKIIPNTRVK